MSAAQRLGTKAISDHHGVSSIGLRMPDAADPWVHLDNLESHIAEAPVTCGYLEPRGGWQPKYRVVLDGGVLALQTPVASSNAPGAGADAVRREIAAWVIARKLGWSKLVAPTVLRGMPVCR
jgi:hypothetical protein